MQRVARPLTRLLELCGVAAFLSAATLAGDDSLRLEPYEIQDGFFFAYWGDAHGRLLMQLAKPVAPSDPARLEMGLLAAEPELIESLPLAVVPPGSPIGLFYKAGY